MYIMKRDVYERATVDADLSINFETIAEFNDILIQTSRIEAEYQRSFSDAEKEFDEIELRLAIVTADVVNEIRIAENTPPSAVGEIRKSRLALDKRYVKVKNKWIDKKHKASILKGLTYTWNHRSQRLGEISTIVNRVMGGNNLIYKDAFNYADKLDLPNK